jgi:predicted GNAT family acetyltransferase
MTPAHEPDRQRFTLPTTPPSVLDYELAPGERPERVVFTHTGVPAAYQGQGLAARLVEAGLAWAQEQGLKVVPACSYVAVYIERHPKWRSLLVSL